MLFFNLIIYQYRTSSYQDYIYMVFVFIVGEREFINLSSNPVFIDVVSTAINNLLELEAASKESF